MICRKCGNELPDEATFCYYCGAQIEDRRSPVPVAPQQNDGRLESKKTTEQTDHKPGATRKTVNRNKNIDDDIVELIFGPLSEAFHSGNFVNNLKTMNFNIIPVIAAIISILSLFFPFASQSVAGFSESFNALYFSGWYSLFIIAMCIMGIFCGIGHVKKGQWVSYMIAVVFSFYFWRGIGRQVEKSYGFAKFDFGIFVLTISLIIAVITAWLDAHKIDPARKKAVEEGNRASAVFHAVKNAADEQIDLYLASKQCPEDFRTKCLFEKNRYNEALKMPDKAKRYAMAKAYYTFLLQNIDQFPEQACEMIQKFASSGITLADAQAFLLKYEMKS